MDKTESRTLDQRETEHLGWASLCHWEENPARKGQSRDVLLIIYTVLVCGRKLHKTASLLRNRDGCKFKVSEKRTEKKTELPLQQHSTGT